MIRRFLPLLLFLSLICASNLFALEVVVTKLGDRSANVEAIAEQTNDLVARVERKTGLKLEGKLSLVACTTRESFEGYLSRFGNEGLANALGVFVPPDASDPNRVPSIGLNLQRIHQMRKDIATTFTHELCHAALDQHISRAYRPLWFEEGMAQWVSESSYETVLGEIGLAGTIDSDPRNMNDISLMIVTPDAMASGYAHAMAAVSSLEDRHGEEGIRKLLATMKASGRDATDVSIAVAYGETFDKSFGKWSMDFIASRQRTSASRIFTFVGNYIFPLSMLLAVVLLIYAVRQKRKRGEAMVEQWKEIDEAFPPDPEYSYGMDEESQDIERAMDEHRKEYGD